MPEVTCNTVEYGGWPNCQRLTNGSIELIVTTDVGPRIIRCGLLNEPNLFFEAPGDRGKTGGDKWRPYGGHRLWHAPEQRPRTYAPDNAPVKHTWTNGELLIEQPVEPSTGISKQIRIRMGADKDYVQVAHKLTNNGQWEVELAVWCLSVMAPGGRAIIPHEKFIPFPEKLLPARPLVLWPYTNMADPRYTWGKRSIQLRQDASLPDCQKFGVQNTFGWGAYELGRSVFLKHAAFQQDSNYPDFGCNFEIYTNPSMLELESLGPLTSLAPGQSAEHVEHWSIERQYLPPDEGAAVEHLHTLAKELQSYSW